VHAAGGHRALIGGGAVAALGLVLAVERASVENAGCMPVDVGHGAAAEGAGEGAHRGKIEANGGGEGKQIRAFFA
jgi:hypothetical protein